MKKLRLDVEGLAVESFESGDALLSSGTVKGAQVCTYYEPDSCSPHISLDAVEYTCGRSCMGPASCVGSPCSGGPECP